MSPTCSPFTTALRSSSRGPPDRWTRSRSSRRPRFGSSPWPENARSGSRRPKPWTHSNGHSRSRPKAIPNAPRFSLDSVRLRCRRGACREAANALEEAIATFRARGDVLASARAMSALGLVLRRLNDSRHIALRAEALAQLEPLPPGPELLEALANVAADSIFAGRALEGLGLADRALVIAAEADLARPARALG